MGEGAKEERYLDRYEVVAVAIPGAAALLFLWYLRPDLFGTKFEFKDVSLGTLGIFAIAAVIAGQVVQAIANLVEEILNLLADLVGRSPAESLAEHGKAKFVDRVRSMGVKDPENINRRRFTAANRSGW